MNKFNEEMYKTAADRLPQIEMKKISKLSAKRISRAAYVKLAADAASVDCRHFSRSFITLRRAIIVLVVLALLFGASATVYAYRNEITETVRRIFTREEELIDQNADMIGESVQSGNVTLTVEKAIRDGDTAYLYLTFTNDRGDFDGIALMYDTLTLKRRATDGKNRENFKPVFSRSMGENGLLAGDILYYIGGEPVPSIKVLLPFNVIEAGEYRLTFDHLFSLGENDDEDESTSDFKYVDYADELSVDFTLGELTDSVALAEYTPMTEFEIDGAALTLTKLSVSPVKITVEIRDLLGQTVEHGGYTFPAIGCLCSLYSPIGISTAEIYADDESWNIFREAYISEEIWRYTYKVRIEFRDGVSSVDKFNSNTGFGYVGGFDEAGNFCAMRSVSMLTSPIYESDIARIYIERADGKDSVVIWENEAERHLVKSEE